MIKLIDCSNWDIRAKEYFKIKNNKINQNKLMWDFITSNPEKLNLFVNKIKWFVHIGNYSTEEVKNVFLSFLVEVINNYTNYSKFNFEYYLWEQLKTKTLNYFNKQNSQQQIFEVKLAFQRINLMNLKLQIRHTFCKDSNDKDNEERWTIIYERFINKLSKLEKDFISLNHTQRNIAFSNTKSKRIIDSLNQKLHQSL
ncbi:hypothetical protein GE118_03960 [Mycoplasma sp. NEAQ87857]|nr:hypothetical protein GE118_03960 [Mycoplasma sp. NEAQ87857]